MKATIAVLAGDGVGPEVSTEAVRVLRTVAECHGHDFTFLDALVGGAAIDATGDPLPASTRRTVEASDAVLLGAVGGPKWSDPSATVRPEQGLLALRGLLGAFANLRPVQPHPALVGAAPIRPELLTGVDVQFVRELTGGMYFGRKSLETDGPGQEVATDHCTYSTSEIERVARVAGQLARERRRRVTSVDKANVLETSRLWRRTVTRVMRDEFPDVTLEHALVDSFAMTLLRAPASFDVVVTENLFGDILTDEAAVLAGSIGVLPSASFGERRADGRRQGIYEPIHGSAPDIAGQGSANPIGTILSAALLLRHSLNLTDEAAHVERAVGDVIADGWRTADLWSAADQSAPVHRASTTAMGAAVVDRLRRIMS
ncbi:MAG: 3-isopropylmalate dehydrogenase [Gemmatimonadetes bacterium]|nr:3-isopropylmalate dehydrogenase [Gemmatimonadota bacterium]